MDKIFSLLENIGGASFLSKFTDSLRSARSNSQLLFLLLVGIFLFLYGLSLGKTKAFVSLLSIYIAFVFDAVFPYLGDLYKIIGFPENLYLFRIGVFLIVYIAVTLTLNLSFLRGRFSVRDFSFWPVTAINALQMIFLASILASFLPTEVANNLLGVAYPYVASQTALFIWAIVPLLALPFFKKY